MGSGLSVPVLGFQTDSFGTGTPLAGTMEDPGGKGETRDERVTHFINKKVFPSRLVFFDVAGLTAIRYGSQTVDPVTGGLARVVGARLDASRSTVAPVTASYWLATSDQTDGVEVGDLRPLAGEPLVIARRRSPFSLNARWRLSRGRRARGTLTGSGKGSGRMSSSLTWTPPSTKVSSASRKQTPVRCLMRCLTKTLQQAVNVSLRTIAVIVPFSVSRFGQKRLRSA